MSSYTHYILVNGDETAEEAGDLAESIVAGVGQTYESAKAVAVFRPDGTMITLDDETYNGGTLEEEVAELRQTIALGAELSIPRVTLRSSPFDLRQAGLRLLARAAALAAIKLCGSADQFDPWVHEYNSYAWGDVGVTHPGADWIRGSNEKWLVVIEFRS